MKKTLIAMAVMSVAGATFAQATLYGRIDASLGSRKVEAAGALAGTAAEAGTNISSSVNSGSRWGLKGTEDLGGGLKANFTLESGFNVDTGTSAQGGALFGRTAQVGVSGGFGSIDMGRIVAIKDNTTWAVTGGYANYAAWGNTVDNGATFGNPNGTIAAPVRRNNAIQYTSPTMGGLSAQIMYQPGENGAPGVGATSYTGLGLGYAAGPISANLSYETSKATPGAGVASAAPAAAGMAAAVDLTETALSATYDFRIAKLAASYIKGSKTGAGDDTGYALGLSAPVGVMTINAEYARVSTTLASGADGGKASALNLRVSYPLSKRTDVYGYYMSGESNGAVAADTQKLTQYQLGLRHVF
jgi:predicted porin